MKAPRAAVYQALIDPTAIAQWKAPTGMTCHVHFFEAREGGSLRISLTYDKQTEAGKTTARTDTYRGRFVELVPYQRLVEVDEFETADSSMRGEMTVTITLADADGGTEVTGLHEGLLPGISTHDNEAGWESALARLAVLLESE